MPITAQRGGTGGLNKRMTNLDPNVGINEALVPNIDSTRDLGAPALAWKDLYVDNLVGPTVFNEAGADINFRFEGLSNENLLSLDAGLDAIGIGVIPIAGVKLALPLENDAATPTLAFGGGGDGLYSRTDTTLSFALQGTWSYNLSTTNLSAVVSGGFQASLRRVTPSATVPSVVPGIVTSSDTGIGLAAAGQLSLIAGGIEGVRVRTGLVEIPDGIGLVVGHTAQIDFGAIPEFQILGTTTADSSMGFGIFENGAIGPDFRFLKSRGATIGSNVIVADGDRLGRIRFQGADGGDFNTTAAELQVEVDGAASANNIFGRFVWRTRSSGGLTTKMTLNKLGDLGVGTALPDEILHTAGAVDGRFTGLLIENTQAPAGGSLNETAEIKFGFGGNNDVARISADKLGDYVTTDDEDARLSFWVASDGVLTQVAHFMPDGLMLLLGNSRIRFAGTAGGGGQSIQYKDLSGSNRAAFLFPGDDIVALVNRTGNGVVEIRANNATGGNSGEVIVATFEDDEIRLLENGGNFGIGTAAPLVGLHTTGLVEGTGDLKDIVALFQGATGGTQTGFLFTSDDADGDVWLALRGLPADTNQWMVGARFFSGDTFAIGYGSKAAGMTFPLDTGAKFVITTGGLVGIGTTTPATSALLELSSTTGALLVPRMTTTQRNALTVSDGMIIYNVTTATMQGRINNAWANM